MVIGQHLTHFFRLALIVMVSVGLGCFRIEPPTSHTTPSDPALVVTPTPADLPKPSPAATPKPVVPPPSKGDFELPERDPKKLHPPAKEKAEEIKPLTDSEVWLQRVKAERKKNSEWMPPIADDPRNLSGVTHCQFSYRVFQVLDDEKMLIDFDGETLCLYAQLTNVVDGRTYKIDGLCKPTGRYQYINTLGGTRTVQAIIYSGPAPVLPPVERVSPSKTEYLEQSAGSSKTVPAKELLPSKESVPPPAPLPKATLTPAENGYIILGGSRVVIDEAAKSKMLFTKWREEENILVVTKPTEVEVIERDTKQKLCRVRLDGKEWVVDQKHVPAEKK